MAALEIRANPACLPKCFAVARKFADAGHEIILPCKDPERAQEIAGTEFGTGYEVSVVGSEVRVKKARIGIDS